MLHHVELKVNPYEIVIYTEFWRKLT